MEIDYEYESDSEAFVLECSDQESSDQEAFGEE